MEPLGDEFVPVVVPDGGEAGSVWRLEKMKDFEWRMRCLGLENDPEYKRMQELIVGYTQDLESMWEEQQKPEYEKKWWQDGEYDARRADECNDRGMVLFGDKDWGEAFHAFTEAIRLHPKSAVFHGNRSAAALRLGQYEVAVRDSLNAIDVDAEYVKGYVRAGKGYLGLEEGRLAHEMFEKGLKWDPENKVLIDGLRQAEEMIERMEKDNVANQEVADRGERRALPRSWCEEYESAAEMVLSAEEILKRNARLEHAMYTKVEGLILCGRYSQAMEYSMSALRNGKELEYLISEAMWRSGDVEGAVQRLDKHLDNMKCRELSEFLKDIEKRVLSIVMAFEDGVYLDAIDLCTELLGILSMGACSGLYCRILKIRADAYCYREQWKDALTDLEFVLKVQSEDVDAMRSKADILKQKGDYTEYFLELQRIKRSQPKLPGLATLIEEAARLSLDSAYQGNQNRDGLSAFGPAEAFAVLELSVRASLSDVRKAYLSLAAKWHPDKWSRGSVDDKAKAEEKFKAIKKAYESIVDSTR